MESANNHIRLGSIIVDPSMLTLEHRQRVRKIAPRDMDVLVYLIKAQGQVVSRDDILRDVWKDVIVNDEAVSLSISRLRTSLGESAKSPKIIRTIPKRGYKVVAPGKSVTVSKAYLALALVSILLVMMTWLFLQVRSVYHQVSDAGM